ncbi:hypothetical protein DY000_02013067 [Brassica cretica]|uniref:Uncharacterized protein n=1 Tax=Brassica cretica TaxID=69181 RepID=A0ABQ7CR56_BRACR|nr:hypothetical protein DY000_02013067 [Brassica cretica]
MNKVSGYLIGVCSSSPSWCFQVEYLQGLRIKIEAKVMRFEEKEAIRLAAMKNGEISKHFQIGDGDRRLFGNVLAKPLVVPSPECSMATVADTCSSCI